MDGRSQTIYLECLDAVNADQELRDLDFVSRLSVEDIFNLLVRKTGSEEIAARIAEDVAMARMRNDHLKKEK